MLFISHDLKPFLQTNSFEAHAKSISNFGFVLVLALDANC
jgi:hypothetical protein